jgi:hypothetical protein
LFFADSSSGGGVTTVFDPLVATKPHSPGQPTTRAGPSCAMRDALAVAIEAPASAA